jgi:PiT family inorganic phosphate transporter
VPVSSSQAIVGAIIGIGILKGGKEVKWDIASKIALGWIILPIIAALIAFLALFVLQNIFNQTISF